MMRKVAPKKPMPPFMKQESPRMEKAEMKAGKNNKKEEMAESPMMPPFMAKKSSATTKAAPKKPMPPFMKKGK